MKIVCAAVIVAAVALAHAPARAQGATATLFGTGPDNVLTLARAGDLALARQDPASAKYAEQAAAFMDRAVADSQLDDPTLRAGIANIPTDSLSFTQEPMTQLQLGLRQQFPAGDTRQLQGERRRVEARAAYARQSLADLEILRDVRLAWLDAFYWTRGQALVRERRAAVNELIDALSASFAAGHMTSQDVLRAELELSLLDDELAEFARREAQARARLSRYVGSVSGWGLPPAFPDLAAPPELEVLEQGLPHHPALGVEDALVAAAGVDVEIAEEEYEPSWAIEGGYGLRGGGRPDLASIGVSLSLPLFADNRQDRRLAAEIHERGAAKLARGERALDLQRDLRVAYADWTGLGARIDLYERAVTARAEEAAEASVTAYGGGLTDFPELIRSQLAQLDAELSRLELRVERAKAWAVLGYFAGDAQ